MLGTYAVPDLIGVEHIGQRVEVVESLAEDDIDHGVNEVQPHQDVPKIKHRQLGGCPKMMHK